MQNLHDKYLKKSDEIKTINDLLSVYSCNDSLTPFDVFETTNERSFGLEYSIPLIASSLEGLSDENFSATIESGIIQLHQFLFRKLYTFAGNYRKSTDPEDGKIFFGKGQKLFVGCIPEDIPSNVQKICSYFKVDDDNPIKSALKFFREFLYYHPFYDGNGRVSRTIVSIYLRYYGLYIEWHKIKRKKYFDYLTKCHNRHNRVGYDHYFSLLLDHFSKHISEINDFEF